METKEKYWNILLYNVEWLRYSETKATVILTVYGVLFTILFTNSTSVFQEIGKSCWLISLSIISGLLSVSSIFFSFRCIDPILKNPNPKSIIYFGHIAEKFKNYSEYFEHSKQIISNNESFIEQISEQIYVNSKIAWKKFTRVTWSLRLFIANLILILIETLFLL